MNEDIRTGIFVVVLFVFTVFVFVFFSVGDPPKNCYSPDGNQLCYTKTITIDYYGD